MKAINSIALLAFFLWVGKVNAQDHQQVDLADSTGMPGDNFSLQGALEMFRQSSSPEDFEKRLNTKDNEVNNLDLNGDGKIDYIKVIDYQKDKVHTITLQVPVSSSESQDIAVIEIEKNGDQTAFLQIIGDEDIYGEPTIVEPLDTPEPSGNSKYDGYKNAPTNEPAPANIYVNVWAWPCVPYIYGPSYSIWISPWYWNYYPMWWSPWHPYPWQYYHMSMWHYHHHYHYYPYYRSSYAQQIYGPRRNTSIQVHNRYMRQREVYKTNVNSKPRPGRPSNVNPASRPTTKPTGRPDYKPAPKPSNQLQSKPSGQPQTKPTSRPQTKPANKPQTKPSSHPNSRPPAHQQSKPHQSKPHSSAPR